MALHLNFLHERESARTQRERDPLKLGILAVLALGGVLGVIHVGSVQKLKTVQREHTALVTELGKLKPQAETAALRERELGGVLKGSEALARRAEKRMLWGPFLELLSQAVPREVHINSFNGGVAAAGNTVEIALDGVAAGSEPRKVAEEFRLRLRSHLLPIYPECEVRFRAGGLEDVAGTVTLDGQQWNQANFVIRVVLPHP